ncbi:hypothetical protein JCM8097_002284 [Rhodosporidiobolus ruineniae]
MSSSHKRQKGLQGQVITPQTVPTPAGAPQAALGLFPSVNPPTKTAFTAYTPTGKAPADGKRDAHVLAGETDEIEYESRNHLGLDGEVQGETEGYAVEYMIGVRNPRTNTLTLHAAPLHTFTPSIKALKATSSSLTPQQLFTAQKAALGSAFGTKKAIKQLRAQERNKLNETSFGTGAHVAGLSSHVQASIAAASSALPTSEAVEASANESRPIPPFNLAATAPNDVYAIDGVVTPAELNSIELSPFITAPGFKERNQLLPYRRAHNTVAVKLRQILPARASAEGNVPNPSKKDRERLKLVIHLAHLFAFRQAARPGFPVDRSKLVEKLGRPSNAVVDALLERYTEPLGAAGEQRKVTSRMEIKLLAYMAVLVLKVDGWSTDVQGFADDLGMGAKRVSEIFRSLGCALQPPSAADREKMVATGQASTVAEAAKSKRAVLKVPLQFPKERKLPKSKK